MHVFLCIALLDPMIPQETRRGHYLLWIWIYGNCGTPCGVSKPSFWKQMYLYL